MITELTKEQEALMEEVVEGAIKNANGGDTSFDKEGIEKFFAFIYKLADLKAPKVVIVESPTAAIEFAEKNGVKVEKIDGLGIGYDSGWTSFYMFFEKIGVDFSDIPEWAEWKKLMDIGLYGCLLFENVAIGVIRPALVKTTESGHLHNESGPAVAWKDGTCQYFLNGINVPKWLIETDAGKIDPMLAFNEKNVDVQREIIRKIGAERMLNGSGAKTIDTFVDSHTNGGNEYQLKKLVVGSISRKYLYFEHASMPGVFYAQPVPSTIERAIHARAWILGMDDPQGKTDAEIKESLPEFVS